MCHPATPHNSTKRYKTSNLTVTDYTTPNYVTSVTTDKLWYQPGETANFTINSAFFEGTPASGQRYTFSCGAAGTSDLITDQQGNTAFRFPVTDRSADMGYQPYTEYYTADLAGAENTYRTTSGNLLVIPRNVILNTTLNPAQDGEYSVDITASKVDTSKVQKDASAWSYTGMELAGEGADIPLKAQVYRVDLIRTKTGEYYDYINKTTSPTYTTTEQSRLLDEYNLQTKDGKATLSGLKYDGTADCYYYIKLTGKDLNGRSFEYTQYIGKYDDWTQDYINQGYKYYTLHTKDDNASQSYWANDTTLADGAETEFSLYQNFKPFEMKGKLLWATRQTGIVSSAVSADSSFRIKMDQALAPNSTLYAAYFDGRHVYAIPPRTLVLDTKSKQLDLKVTTDKDRYAPGDTVTASLALTNGGKAASGEYVFSVVDEALFALSDQDYQGVQDLYAYLNLPEVTTNSSYVQYVGKNAESADMSAGGKGGGGGDDTTARKVFKDTAYFTAGQTDASGKATVTFKVPDNLTEWRLTSAACSGGTYAGSSISRVTVGQNFFVQPVVGSRYLTGEDVTFTARARSRDGSSPANVSYKAVLNRDGKAVATLEGKGNIGSFNFGQLEAGDYTVDVTAAADAGSDTVEKTFRVTESGLEVPVTQTLDLGKTVQPDALRYPVAITFSSKQYGTYAKVLDTLASAWGRRIDQRVARKWAAGQLQQSGGTLPYYLADDVDLSDLSYQPLVSLMPYGSPDYLLTGKLCAAAPQYLDTNAVAARLTADAAKEDAAPETVVGCYLGLAALHQPVLSDLRTMAADPSFTAEEHTYLIAALGFIGDQAGARAAYESTVAPTLTRENSWAYVSAGESGESGDGSDLTFEATARALLAATACHSDDAPLLAEYLCGNPSGKALANLELMAYASAFGPKNDDSGKVSYTDAQGQRQTIDLSQQHTATVSFTRDALAKADIKVESGDVEARTMYIGSSDEASAGLLAGVSVTKTLKNQDGGTSFAPGDQVYVTLNVTFGPKAPQGYYSVVDCLPSGMRFSGLPGTADSSQSGAWGSAQFNLQQQEEQNQYFGLYFSRSSTQPLDGTAPVVSADGSRTISLTYLARCALPGSYRVEGVWLTQAETGRIARSADSKVTIAETAADTLPQLKLTSTGAHGTV